MEHAQTLAQSFVDYLTSLDVWQEDLTNADGAKRIFAGEDTGTKDAARIICYCAGDLQEQPPMTGNRWADFMVELKTPMVEDGGVSLSFHKENAAALEAAIMDSALSASLRNSAIYVYQATERNPFQDEDEMGWTSGIKLRVFSVMN